jgi:hypothetical protein
VLLAARLVEPALIHEGHRVGPARVAEELTSLERPHACMDGYVYIGYVVESRDELDGEVVEYARVPCRRCADSR